MPRDEHQKPSELIAWTVVLLSHDLVDTGLKGRQFESHHLVLNGPFVIYVCLKQQKASMKLEAIL